MNKKGDITVTIFVIGVVALCFFALVSFYMSSLDTSNNFEQVQLIEKVNFRAEKGGNDFDGKINGTNYYKESSSSSSFYFWQEKKLFFEIKYFPN